MARVDWGNVDIMVGTLFEGRASIHSNKNQNNVLSTKLQYQIELYKIFEV